MRARIERERPRFLELRGAHEGALSTVERVGERRRDAQADLGTLAHQLLEPLARQTPDARVSRRLHRRGPS